MSLPCVLVWDRVLLLCGSVWTDSFGYWTYVLKKPASGPVFLWMGFGRFAWIAGLLVLFNGSKLINKGISKVWTRITILSALQYRIIRCVSSRLKTKNGNL